ncbi:MAG TPA: aminotransferase class V-fold PLP-dependent enzyme [Ktedonobacterales bacterium]|jgi:L-cysteine/cystine lyase|nr:aminotransferase class V-fold PLP-dependent enzyme [Ktedonobacterales bacterium]
MDTEVWPESGVGTAAERDKLAAIRNELPATQRFVYFNTGTNGPLPRRTHEVLVASSEYELEQGRIGHEAFTRLFQNLTDARAALAGVLGCDEAEVALTHNTTEGMNIALMGLDWQRGDEVVSSKTEHPGGLYPLYMLHQRYGVKIRATEIGLQDRDPLDELQRALTPRTRAVVLSHVCWSTGMVFPLREMAELAHSVGALLICDAAQSCGMVPSNVYDLGVDAYACSGQKWLCGPDGTGALFVRRDRLGDIKQTFMGYFGVQNYMSDFEGNYVPSDSARRYEVATLYPGGLRALKTSVLWIGGEEVGWDWAYQRIATLGRYCYSSLAALDGVNMLTPPDRMAGLVHFKVEGIAPADLTTKLGEVGVMIRHTPYPEANRVATGFYNTEAEVDRLVEAIQQIQLAPSA